MKRRRRATPLVVLLLAAALYFLRSEKLDLPSSAPPPDGWRLVVRVIDGDTLLLDNDERVRLIGVDTPESVDPRRPVEYFGKEAAAFVRRLAEGRRVRLESGDESRDRYDRTLAYVYLEDGTFLNAEIIRQGYGHAYTRYPFRYAEQFRALEREARENQRGLWAP
jgi:micrococcal nuclease